MHFTVIVLSVIVAALLLTLFNFLKKNRLKEKELLLQKLLLQQFRYQTDPHHHLNQINSLAVLPSQIAPKEMQSRILVFGRELRKAFTFTNQTTQTAIEQSETATAFIESENEKRSNQITLSIVFQNSDIKWLPLPSYLLVNTLKSVLQSEGNSDITSLKLVFSLIDTTIRVVIECDAPIVFAPRRGIADDLIEGQLSWFNSTRNHSFSLTSTTEEHHCRVIAIFNNRTSNELTNRISV